MKTLLTQFNWRRTCQNIFTLTSENFRHFLPELTDGIRTMFRSDSILKGLAVMPFKCMHNELALNMQPTYSCIQFTKEIDLSFVPLIWLASFHTFRGTKWKFASFFKSDLFYHCLLTLYINKSNIKSSVEIMPHPNSPHEQSTNHHSS